MTDKPIVKYRKWHCNQIAVGHSAFVIPVNHPEAGERGIINEYPIHTSTVLSHDEDTGSFETKNTIYELESA